MAYTYSSICYGRIAISKILSHFQTRHIALDRTLESTPGIATLPQKEKKCLLTTVDHFIKASKISLM